MRASALYAIVTALVFSTSCLTAETTNPSSEPSFIKSQQTLGNTRSFGMAIADVDLDNDLDILIANYIGPSRLWINDGFGGFTISDQTFPASPGVSGEAHDVGMADFNGDLYPDVFIVFHDAPSKVFLNDGSGGFSDNGQAIGTSTDYPQTVQLADIDNDNDVDASICNGNAANSIWYNDGNGTFTKGDVDFGGSGSNAILLADFTNDSSPDMYISLRTAQNQVWINDGSGEFTLAGLDLDCEVGHMVAGDIDGDGDIDLVISQSSQIMIQLNQNHEATFLTGNTISEGALRLALFDADSDNDLDLITADIVNGNKLWINDGSGSFTSQGTVFGTSRVLSIKCADVENDGDLDVVTGQLEGTGGNSIYLNDSVSDHIGEEIRTKTGYFQLQQNYPNPFNPSTTISYVVQQASDVGIHIYNVLGRRIAHFDQGRVNAGYHQVVWDGRTQSGQPVPAGMYFCRMETSDNVVKTIKMLVVR